MSFHKRNKQIQDMTDNKAFHFSAKLGANEAYESFYYTVRRDSNDNTETV